MKLSRKKLRELILKEFKDVHGKYSVIDIAPPKIDIGGGFPPTNLPPERSGREEPCYNEDSESFQRSFNYVLEIYSSVFDYSGAIYDFLEDNDVIINYNHSGPGAGDMERNMIMALSRDICLGEFKGGISSNELTSILLNVNRLKEYINPEYLS